MGIRCHVWCNGSLLSPFSGYSNPKPQAIRLTTTRTWLNLKGKALSLVDRMDIKEPLDYDLVSITVESKSHLRIARKAKNTQYPTLDFLVQGEANHRGHVQDIRLIVTKSERPYQFLQGFHSTAVQSYITAHTACHMFGKLTERDEMYEWPDIKRFTHTAAAREKYRDRGFMPISIP